MNTYWHAFIDPLHQTAVRLISFVPRFFVAFVLFLLFFGLATLARRGVRRSLVEVHHIPGSVRILIARGAYIFVLILGFMVALSAANVNITALLASLGVAGFALGFAFKDILENFIAGILLLFSRPFEVGDQVTLGSFSGTVTDIELRTTTVETYAGERVAIPNSNVFSNPVVNHTALKCRRYLVAFDTSLTADAKLVESVALDAARQDHEVLEKPAPFITMASVDSGADILSWHLYYWAPPTKAVEIHTVSRVLERIKARLFDVGVPTPTSTSATIIRRPERAHDGESSGNGAAPAERDALDRHAAGG